MQDGGAAEPVVQGGTLEHTPCQEQSVGLMAEGWDWVLGGSLQGSCVWLSSPPHLPR